MIKLISVLPEYESQDIGFVKLCCAFKAYGNFDKIALFWAQTDSIGKTTALISKIDNDVIITENGGDLTEIREFISVLGAESVFCETSLAEKLGLKIETEAPVYKAEPPYNTDNASENLLIGVKGLYERLKDDFKLNEQSFIADVSHRLRHNAAFYVTGKFSAVLCQCCDNFCFICGFVTDSSMRGKGLGSAALRRLFSFAKQRPIYVCARENAIPCYLRNNFVQVGSAAYCTLGDIN